MHRASVLMYHGGAGAEPPRVGRDVAYGLTSCWKRANLVALWRTTPRRGCEMDCAASDVGSGITRCYVEPISFRYSQSYV